MISSKQQLHFKGPYLRQNLSLSYLIIDYITKTPSNSKGWQKLIHSCKYFFEKNRIFAVNLLFFTENKKWNAVLKNDEKYIDFKTIPCKLWIFDRITVNFNETLNSASLIIPYIYKVNATVLNLSGQIISFSEFLFLSSNVEEIYLYHTTVVNEDGSIVPLEKLVNVLLKIKEVKFYDKPVASYVTSNTVKKLLKIPHFSKIEKFQMFNIPEEFDIQTFFKYLKKNKNTKFNIEFCNSLFGAYKNLLKSIVDEILETKNHDYKVPVIYFPGLSYQKHLKMESLSN